MRAAPRISQAIARVTGFFSLTLVPLTILHLEQAETLGEMADAILSTLVFGLIFGVGGWLGTRLVSMPERRSFKPSSEFMVGALAALALWMFLWAFWSVTPRTFGYGYVHAAFIVNLTFALLTGTVTSVLRHRHAKSLAEHNNKTSL